MSTNIYDLLNKEFTEPVRDPLWQNIYLSPAFKKIINEAPFQRLGRIKQLGPTYHIYPGATHTRLNHSLGVFHLSKRILQTLLGFNGCISINLEEGKAFLCAALLHDLGHFPFAHSLKELPLKDHEILTAELVLSSPLKDKIKNELHVDPEMVAAIVDTGIPISGTGDTITFFRNILSGVLDPDKLDYLNRDAFFCGVPYGIQDTDFVISKMIPNRKTGIALQEQGLPAVENILFSKYLMYKTVYWHKTVRIATAMIKKALYAGIINSVISPSDLYNLDDDQFFIKFSNHHYPPFRLIKEVYNRNFFKSVFEITYDSSNPIHKGLTDLNTRLDFENNIAAKIRSSSGKEIDDNSVIIDIPESISFEFNLPIHLSGGIVPFTESGSVFSGPVVNGFTRTLRKIRIMVPPAAAEGIKNPDELLS